MARGVTTQRVEFAKEVTSIRPPRDDELWVMTQFARHAAKCDDCRDPYGAFKQDRLLCDKGNALARDVANYLYSKGDKPFSVINKKEGERMQVEVPADCKVIESLVKAFGRGLVLRVPKPVKPAAPVVLMPKVDKHDQYERVEKIEKYDRPAYYPSRPDQDVKVYRKKEYHVDDRPRERRYREGDVDMVEIVPVSARRERKEKVYYGNRVEERPRYERKERPKSVSYPERKGSLYERDEEEQRRRQRYEEQPIVIVSGPRHYRR
ncbi:uncharacterized protein Z518_03991 [Rhinocladiella mackenziei CBS 650.93]|uniref:Uncharacterized protein n=1 Tax=Rhinocladiella mackenziei CBS 650.93 TaxID=1442369 RepID=A0A0D2FVB2_9EURO|nr:uncharacterized protein Z518_03991 [Rhinocladiella mackenziei CBS 650.93]KIX06017.1 hypothetical protein Z518_03991 [Rhinocladiella mackenziei CBS 650.93]